MIDRTALLLQGLIVFGICILATVAAVAGQVISGDALVGVYGAALGIYGGETVRRRKEDRANGNGNGRV